MSTESVDELDDRQLALQIAKAYYLDDLTKVQIADGMGMSRFKVARLLKLARETGTVTISVNEDPQPEDMLATRLRHLLGLRECQVIPTGKAVNPRRQIAVAAAGYLATRLAPHDVLGLAWGRTLATMTEYLVDLPPVKVVQLTGSVGSDLAISPTQILSQITQRSGGEAVPIMAPLVADSVEAMHMMRAQTPIRRALDSFSEMTIAMLSVGSISPSTSQLWDNLDADAQRMLESSGAEGEVTGIFLTRSGEVVDVEPVRKFIGISAEELRAVPRTIIVADGAVKAGSVLGAVRAGLANTLLVDVALATTMLGLLDGE
ncbi:MAG: sugar-binding transcriptional regulator [Arachnia sp.]